MHIDIWRMLICMTMVLGSLWCVEHAEAWDGYRLPPSYPNAWRGRMVSRRGLFNVDRAHWGNGITPTGGQVLITGFNTFGQVAPMIWGGGVPALASGAAAAAGNQGTVEKLDESAEVDDVERLNPIIEKGDERLKMLADLKKELCSMLDDQPAACSEPEPAPAPAEESETGGNGQTGEIRSSGSTS